MTTTPSYATHLYYLCEFDVDATTPISCVVNTSFTATPANGTYTWDGSLASYDSGLGDFGVAVRNALNAAVADGTWSVTLNSDNKVVLARSTTFTIAWTGTAGRRLRTWLGFDNDLSGAATYTATYTPYYLTVPVIDARTAFTDTYEADGSSITVQAESDGGDVYSVSKNTEAKWCDWSQSAESYATTYILGVTRVLDPAFDATSPWTWEAFFQYVRGERLIFVWQFAYSGYSVHRLRATGTNFRPRRMAADDNTYWIVDFKTYQVGRYKP